MSPGIERALRRTAVVLEVLLSVAAIGGGITFLLDPTGSLMGMRPDELRHTPFADYRAAGAALLLVHGALPWVAIGAERQQRPWAPAAHLGVALALDAWMGFQVLTMGLTAPPQVVMITHGAAMTGVATALWVGVSRRRSARTPS